jgi:hypothetical protein
MGANAVTTVPVYVSGEVLTAADLNITNSGIPVFASTVERDAAFGGTGEKTLAEGQFAYLETGNVTQYYDGAAWQPVGVTPGLVLVKSGSFSAVSSVSLPDNSFTSTYKAYRMVFNLTAASTGLTVTARFRAAGTDNTSNAYRAFTVGMDQLGTGRNNTGGTNTSMFIGDTESSNDTLFSVFDLDDVATASEHPILGMTYFNNGSYFGVYYTAQSFSGNGNAFDSMTFLASTGNITGTYRLYGYSEV